MFRWKNHDDDSFFNDINGKKLDKDQIKAVKDDSQELLVVAGAGSGKTLTIVAKVRYLIEKCGYKKEDILCLSFTNETVKNLKEKVGVDVDVYTFHKLALNILDDNKIPYLIAQENFLNYIVDEYFLSFVNNDWLSSYFNNLDKNDILKSLDFQYLKQLIISFIRYLKSNNVSITKLKSLKNNLDEHEKLFYLFALQIYQIYEEELFASGRIDFDDMILMSTDLIIKNEVKKTYRFIIIDEYQDISYIRFNLIREILKKTDARLMCVGDDYQAIYGFSGSRVSFFIDFFHFFPKARRIDIRKTYRNSYELIKISLRFILKNPYQLRKKIRSTFLYKYPVVLVYYDDNYLETYQNVLNYLYLENEHEVMVLARYNRDLEEIKKIPNKGINVNYLTVHMSKGLESENVLLIKMQDAYLGFPSKIRDYSIMEKIRDGSKEMPYAEERRLFYVALTRTKKRIFLLVPRANPSVFIREIRKYCVELILE